MDLIERLLQLSKGPRDHIVLPLFSAHNALRLSWLPPEEVVWEDYPELDDVMEELAAYLPLASVQPSEGVFRCLLVQREAPHAVSLFYEGFQRVSPSLDAFAASLLSTGEQTPAAALDAAVDSARAHIDARDYAPAVALLTRALQHHPQTPGEQPERGLRDLLRAGWTDLGVAHHELGEASAAADAYQVAVAWGSKVACGNLLTLAMDGQRWQEARAVADELDGFHLQADELNTLRAKTAQLLAELAERDAALAIAAKHSAYLRELAASDHTRAVALQNSFLGAIDAWLGSPASRDILVSVRSAIAVPLPLPPPPAQANSGDIATALRLVGAGKIMQLRSLLSRLPVLAKEPALTTAVEQLTPSADKATMQQMLLDAR